MAEAPPTPSIDYKEYKARVFDKEVTIESVRLNSTRADDDDDAEESGAVADSAESKAKSGHETGERAAFLASPTRRCELKRRARSLAARISI